MISENFRIINLFLSQTFCDFVIERKYIIFNPVTNILMNNFLMINKSFLSTRIIHRWRYVNIYSLAYNIFHFESWLIKLQTEFSLHIDFQVKFNNSTPLLLNPLIKSEYIPLDLYHVHTRTFFRLYMCVSLFFIFFFRYCKNADHLAYIRFEAIKMQINKKIVGELVEIHCTTLKLPYACTNERFTF